MTTINSVGNGLSGVTGSGNFVGANTPTLITPVLGVATATSINFGGSTLSTYVSETSWTPVFTFGAPGDLAVSYTLQSGRWTQIGNLVTLTFYIAFTPTFTTSSGFANVNGFPFTAAASPTTNIGSAFYSHIIFVGNQIALEIDASTSEIVFAIFGSGQASTALTTANFVSGTAYALGGTITIMI